MKQKGICCWEKLLSAKNKEIDTQTKRFLKNVFSQQWIPKKGKVIELGCGTAPILRWVCRKGFEGFGVDISKTAISMAKKQSAGLNIRFKTADVCSAEMRKLGLFDVIIDGHCLHCIISTADRKRFFKNTSGLLTKDGILIIMTMCGPINKRKFSEICRGHKILKDTLYVKAGNNRDMPVRKILSKQKIAREIKEAGFDILLSKYIKPIGEDPFGSFMAAAIKK